MRRLFLSVAALALLLFTADTANAQYRWGYGGWGGGWYGYPGYSVSYGTRIGSGYLNLGYSSGWGYPAYYGYSAPVYYSTPYYYSGYYRPYYYGGYSPYYYRSGFRWGW